MTLQEVETTTTTTTISTKTPLCEIDYRRRKNVLFKVGVRRTTYNTKA